MENYSNQITKITDYLDRSALMYPDWDVCVDGDTHISYKMLKEEALQVAQILIDHGFFKVPVIIYMDKCPECISSLFGVCYSGNFYSILDTFMPAARVEKIKNTLHPKAVITDDLHFDDVQKMFSDAVIFRMSDIKKVSSNAEIVRGVTEKVLDTDIQYVLFTSGSTGNPKGVVTTHRNVINYIEATSDIYRFDHSTRLCSQVPFYFVMSIVDIFGAVRNGGTLHIIPKMLYSFPAALLEYISENKINSLYWVCSALNIVANMDAFDTADISCLRWIGFGGEVMPMKQLNAWIKAVPDCRFINVYGPTEVTDGITYYEVNRKFKDNQTLPIGVALPNLDVFVLNENGELVKPGEIGELCVRGGQLTLGYYGDEEKTKEAFVQIPFNHFYEEKMYRTGDLVYLNEYGEYEFAGRKDFQIKHMGNRIELGEIEANVSSIGGVDENACLYNADLDHIALYYSGSVSEVELLSRLKVLVPQYMIPNKVFKLENMPHNLNGKIDRAELKRRVVNDDK